MSSLSKYLLSCSIDDTIYTFSCGDGQLTLKNSYRPFSSIKEKDIKITDLKWNHNNLVLISSCNKGYISINREKTGGNLGYLPSDQEFLEPLSCLCLSSGSRYLGTGGSDMDVKVWDLKQKKILKDFSGHSDFISCVSFNNDDRHITSASKSGEIFIHDVFFNHEILNLSSKTPITDLNYSKFYTSIFGTGEENGVVRLWDVEKGKMYTKFSRHESACKGVRFSLHNHLLLLSIGAEGRLLLYDIKEKKEVQMIYTGKPLNSLSFLEDGRHVAIGTSDGEILIYDINNTHKPLYKNEIKKGKMIQNLNFQILNRRTKKKKGVRNKMRKEVKSRSAKKKTPRRIQSTPKRDKGEEDVEKKDITLEKRISNSIEEINKELSKKKEEIRVTESLEKIGEYQEEDKGDEDGDIGDIVDEKIDEGDEESGMEDDIGGSETFPKSVSPVVRKSAEREDISQFLAEKEVNVSKDEINELIKATRPSKRTIEEEKINEIENTNEEIKIVEKIPIKKEKNEKEENELDTFEKEFEKDNEKDTGLQMMKDNILKSPYILGGSSPKKEEKKEAGVVGEERNLRDIVLGLEKGFEKFKFSIHNDVQNLHIDVLRQFHLQQQEMTNMIKKLSDKVDKLVKDNQNLKVENEYLRNINY